MESKKEVTSCNVRITSEIKSIADEDAKSLGMAFSTYVRYLIIKERNKKTE